MINNRPEQCSQMKKMRRQLYGATPEGQNLIAKRISDHFKSCEQCAEWWDWVSENKEVPAPSLYEVTGSSRRTNADAREGEY